MRINSIRSHNSMSFGSKVSFQTFEKTMPLTEQFLKDVTKTFENKTAKKDSEMIIKYFWNDKKGIKSFWHLKYVNGDYKDVFYVWMKNNDIMLGSKDFALKLKEFLKFFETREKQVKKYQQLQKECDSLKKQFQSDSFKNIREITGLGAGVNQIRDISVLARNPEWI